MRRQEGKKGLISDIFVIRRIAWTSKRQLSSLSLLSLTALCLWLNCMDVRTSPKTTACSRSGNRHLSINQSIITSNSLYPLFFLSHFHTQTVSIRDWTRKEVTGVSYKKKRAALLPPLVRTDNAETSLVSSEKNHSSVRPLHSPLSLSTPPEVLKGKS